MCQTAWTHTQPCLHGSVHNVQVDILRPLEASNKTKQIAGDIRRTLRPYQNWRYAAIGNFSAGIDQCHSPISCAQPLIKYRETHYLLNNLRCCVRLRSNSYNTKRQRLEYDHWIGFPSSSGIPRQTELLCVHAATCAFRGLQVRHRQQKN